MVATVHLPTSAADQPVCLCGSTDFAPVREGRFNFFPVDGQAVPFRILACRHCALCVTAPRPGQHIAFQAYDSARDAAEVGESDMLLATSRYRLAKILARVGRPTAGLEIGCSTGPLVEMLSQAGVPLSIGVELHQPAVAGALRQGRNVRGVSLEACAFADGSFDFVQAHHVLEHVAELHPLLLEVRRVLRPGGHVYFTVPCHDTPLARSDDWSGWFPQEHFWHFERDTLVAVLKQHGFGNFHTTRPMLTDFVAAEGAMSAAKKLARSAVREMGLGDTLEVWAERLA